MHLWTCNNYILLYIMLVFQSRVGCHPHPEPGHDKNHHGFSNMFIQVYKFTTADYKHTAELNKYIRHTYNDYSHCFTVYTN